MNLFVFLSQLVGNFKRPKNDAVADSIMKEYTMNLSFLSRHGRTDASGKLTCRLDIPVSEELVDAVAALATVHGISKAECARAIIEEAVYGRLQVLRRLTVGHAPGQSDESPMR